jgi:hypothetical protein
MKTAVAESTSFLEPLTQKVEALEARLSALEDRVAAIGQSPPRPASPAAAPPTLLQALDLPPLPRLSAVLAAGGKVFLGIAGAYLLRAVAESGLVPQMIAVAVALAYAAAWLVWAARIRSDARLAIAASAVTAGLILSPMLWELTMRFRILPPPAAAAVLAVFTVLAYALSWKRDLTAVVSVASLTSAITGVVLLMATRDPAPFVVALLVMALTSETAACRERYLNLRPIVAVVSDFAALVLILVYTQEGGAPAEYKPIIASLLLALFVAGIVIYGTSTVFRTVVLERRISIFEILQTAVAFLLAVAGILRISQAAGVVLGGFCLLAAAAAYYAAFARLARLPQARNYHVFASWGGTLFLLGSFLMLPVMLWTPWLAVAALATVVAGTRWLKMTVGFHGAVYAFTAALVSGLLAYGGNTLAGALPPEPGWRAWTAAMVTFACYTVVSGPFSAKDSRSQRLLRLAYAAPAAYVATALAVALAVFTESRVTSMNPPLLAATRTTVICLAALALAIAGSRWKRIELVWLGYAAIGSCTLKLMFEDLRYGSAGSIAVSLFCYGMAWVLVSRGRATQE